LRGLAVMPVVPRLAPCERFSVRQARRRRTSSSSRGGTIRPPYDGRRSVRMHIRRFAWLGLLPALVVSLPAAAAEDIETIFGEWEQIASNAGACPTCRITFETRGKSFTVTANNG
ncbi:MAG: hypothetical protein JWQ05_405, partial [Methylobacterium sp.]|nr:hypothetical protein [Methylobacterium sp.]